MAARIVEICDAVTAYLTANWVGTVPTIERVYTPEFDHLAFVGPSVFVFPTAYQQAEMLDRKSDIDAYRVTLLFVEKCIVAGLPTVAWLDARVLLVEGQIYEKLSDHRTPAIAGLWPETAEVTSVYDFDFLRATNLFISEIEIEFREVA